MRRHEAIDFSEILIGSGEQRSDTGRNKTVVTAISKISDRPVAKEACLVVIYGLELGKKFNLNRPQIIIGRSSKADIQIDQEAVSRNHCKIINTGSMIMLRDMGSTNGTYVNDEMIDEYVLRDGDFIKVGRCIFKFLSGNNIENAYHEEIYRLTTVDGLTQIFNRRYFVETLEREIGRALPISPRAVADHVRYRPLQGRQRLVRPPRRRSRLEAPRVGDQDADPARGCARPLRRRGVRDRAARDRSLQLDGVRGEGPQARRGRRVQVRRRDHPGDGVDRRREPTTRDRRRRSSSSSSPTRSCLRRRKLAAIR